MYRERLFVSVNRQAVKITGRMSVPFRWALARSGGSSSFSMKSEARKSALTSRMAALAESIARARSDHASSPVSSRVSSHRSIPKFSNGLRCT